MLAVSSGRGSLLALFFAAALHGCSSGGSDTPGSGGSSSVASGGVTQPAGGVASTTGGAAPTTGGGASTTPSGGTAGTTGGSPSAEPRGGSGGVVGGSASGSGGGTPAGAGGVASGGTASGGAATGGAAGTGAQSGNPSSAGAAGSGGAAGGAGSSPKITFGTSLAPEAVVKAARDLAQSLVDPNAPGYREKGDRRRTYRNPETGKDEPYRISVPSSWDGAAPLPAVMFLHGAGSDENTYLDQNSQQLLKLAEQHGYLLISPRGVDGAYGNFLRLTAPFGDEEAAAALVAQVTPQAERTNELSEQDVINVLELVLAEYPVDRSALFLAGHSMGSGGTWYIGGKYSAYWRALAPMSGPFVQPSGYPWEAVRNLSLFVTEGTQTPSLEASRRLAEWLRSNGFTSEYQEVNADHGGMIPLVLPDVFEFFDRSR